MMREKRRRAECRAATRGRAMTDVYIGLHIGDVFYGNIGSQDRLDFTVIGPAVNEVSRIAHVPFRRSQRVDLLRFRRGDTGAAASALACVGRYALRGVSRAQELYTLDSARLNG